MCVPYTHAITESRKVLLLYPRNTSTYRYGGGGGGGSGGDDGGGGGVGGGSGGNGGNGGGGSGGSGGGGDIRKHRSNRPYTTILCARVTPEYVSDNCG